MARYKLLKNGEVVNTVVATSSFLSKLIQSGEIDSYVNTEDEFKDDTFYWYEGSFRECLTLEERVLWDNDSVPEAVTVKAEIIDGKFTRDQIIPYVNLLTQSGSFSEDSLNDLLNLDLLNKTPNEFRQLSQEELDRLSPKQLETMTEFAAGEPSEGE